MDNKRVAGKRTALTARQKKQQFREKLYKKNLGTQKEGQGFADKNKQKAVYQYRKLLRKSEAKEKYQKTKVDVILESSDEPAQERSKKSQKAFNALKKAEQEHKKKLAEKQEIKKQIAEKQRQQDEALAKYQKNKKEKFKLLCKKNFRGQPKVAGQMAILLDRIQSSQKEG